MVCWLAVGSWVLVWHTVVKPDASLVTCDCCGSIGPVQHMGLQAVAKRHLCVLDAALDCLPLQTRSFQYIDDLIRGMVAVMDGDEIGPFNVGNPGEFTMLELANVSVVQHDCVRGQPLRCVAPCHVCKPGFMSVLVSVACCAICGL